MPSEDSVPVAEQSVDLESWIVPCDEGEVVYIAHSREDVILYLGSRMEH